MRKVVGSRFIIISGNLSFRTVQDFLSEFYHPTHDKGLSGVVHQCALMTPLLHYSCALAAIMISSIWRFRRSCLQIGTFFLLSVPTFKQEKRIFLEKSLSCFIGKSAPCLLIGIWSAGEFWENNRHVSVSPTGGHHGSFQTFVSNQNSNSCQPGLSNTSIWKYHYIR